MRLLVVTTRYPTHDRPAAGAFAATGTIREPYPEVVEAPIAMDDIARVAAALLARPDDAHLGRMYELTGPESLTRARIAEHTERLDGTHQLGAIRGTQRSERRGVVEVLCARRSGSREAREHDHRDRVTHAPS